MRGLRSVASFVIAHWHRDMYLSVTISFESGNSEGVCYKSAHLSSNRLLVSHTVSMNMFRQMIQSRLVLHLWTSVALDESALKLSWAQTLIDQDHIYLKSKHQWFQCFSTWKKPTVSYFCPWHAMAQRSKWPVSFWKTKASIVALGDRCGTPESRHLPAPAPCVVLAHFGYVPSPLSRLLIEICWPLHQFSSEVGVHSRRIHRTKSKKIGNNHINGAVWTANLWYMMQQNSNELHEHGDLIVVEANLHNLHRAEQTSRSPSGSGLSPYLSYHIQDTSRYFKIFQVQLTLNWIGCSSHR